MTVKVAKNDSSARLKVELLAPGAPPERAGSVHSVDPGVLRVDTGRMYAEGEALRVRIGGRTVTGQVSSSVRRGENFRTAVALERLGRFNRRGAPRTPVEWSAHVWIIGDAPDVFEARVTDLSQSGLGLLAPKPVNLSEQVGVETAECMAFGEVLHCDAEPGGGYRLGVRVVELLGADGWAT